MTVPAVFTERQWLLRHWWPLLLLPTLLGPVLVWLVPRRSGSSPNWEVIVVVALVTLFIACCKLDTRFDGQGVYYRLFPLHWSWQHLPWSEVTRAYVRKYDPLGEYGGWGLKGSARNRAYTIANDEGLQLELRNGRRVLLGTQHPAELRQVLARLPVAASGAQ